MDDKHWLVGPLVTAGIFIASCILGALSWFFRLERRLNNVLTVQKHEEICKESDAQVNAKLDKLEQMLVDSDRLASTFRHDIRGTVQVLVTKTEVLSTKLDHVRETQAAVKEDLAKYQEKLERNS